jgi:alkaline phosphatase D
MRTLAHRCLLALAASVLLAACDDGNDTAAPETGGVADGVTFALGVASGDVTDGTAVLWTRAEPATALVAEVAADDDFGEIVATVTTASAAERDFTVRATVGGLAAGTRYWYRFRAGDAVSDTGTFVTAPGADASSPVTFVFAGDSDGRRNADGAPAFNEFEVLDAAAGEQPDFFLYFGDTIYGDRAPAARDVDGFRAKYRENRAYAALRRIAAATPMYNAWDDHEVENDYDGATVDPALYAAGRQAFYEYWPLSVDGGDPLYRHFRWSRDVELFVLDGRSYRSPSAAGTCAVDGSPDVLPGAAAPGAPEGLRAIRGFVGLPPELPPGCAEMLADPARTMLGAEQKQWLKNALRRSGATWKVLVNPVPIQEIIALPYDRWEGYAAERRELLEFIRDEGIKNVVFLTTDFHANIYGPVRVDSFAGGEPVAYEAVVGPIATEPLRVSIAEVVGDAGAAALGGLLTSVAGVDCAELESYAYGVVSVDPDAGTMSIASKDADGNVLCEKTLTAE